MRSNLLEISLNSLAGVANTSFPAPSENVPAKDLLRSSRDFLFPPLDSKQRMRSGRHRQHDLGMSAYLVKKSPKTVFYCSSLYGARNTIPSRGLSPMLRQLGESISIISIKVLTRLKESPGVSCFPFRSSETKTKNTLTTEDYLGNWPITEEQRQRVAKFQRMNKANCKKNVCENIVHAKLKEAGYQFKRQRRWGFRIFDFWCHRLGLAIEVDGKNHNPIFDKKRDDQDFKRSAILVYRIKNEHVYNALAIEELLRKIKHTSAWNSRRQLLKKTPINRADEPEENYLDAEFRSLIKNL